MRQVDRPAQQANWTEYFYEGELKVVNGETETDNQVWIDQLLVRGFRNVEEIPQDVKVYGEVRTEDSVEPLGTQVARAAETESEREHVKELVKESESAFEEDQAEKEDRIEEQAEQNEEDEEGFEEDDEEARKMFEEPKSEVDPDLERMVREAGLGDLVKPRRKTRTTDLTGI